MPGFRIFRGTDVPTRTALDRIRDLLQLEGDRISRAVDLAVSQAGRAMFAAAELGAAADELGVTPQAAVHAVNTIRFLAGYLDRYTADEADWIADFRLAGLGDDAAQRLPQVLDAIRPHATTIAASDRELEAAYEGLPTITDFGATCDLRAIFRTPLGVEDVLAPERANGENEQPDLLAWVPIAVITLETRDLAGERKATTFQAPLPILQNLVRALDKVKSRLERTIDESAGPAGPSESA